MLSILCLTGGLSAQEAADTAAPAVEEAVAEPAVAPAAKPAAGAAEPTSQPAAHGHHKGHHEGHEKGHHKGHGGGHEKGHQPTSQPAAHGHYKGHGKGHHKGHKKWHGKWPAVTVQPGLQMWTPVYAGSDGTLRPQSTLGGVLKVNYAINDTFGVHVRGVYGGNSTVEHRESDKASFSAWAVGLGVDFSLALGKRAIWTNTMGLGYGTNNSSYETGSGTLTHPEVTALGAYFVTGFDVTIMGPMGVWMDWGCQIVGPSTATLPAEGNLPAAELSTWHINALGAGGMRIAF